MLGRRWWFGGPCVRPAQAEQHLSVSHSSKAKGGTLEERMHASHAERAPAGLR